MISPFTLAQDKAADILDCPEAVVMNREDYITYLREMKKHCDNKLFEVLRPAPRIEPK